MNSIVGVTRFVDSHMITKYKLLETFEYNKVQIRIKVTSNKKRTYYVMVASLDVSFLRKYEEI